MADERDHLMSCPRRLRGVPPLALLWTLAVPLGCALDDRFVDSERGKPYDVPGSGNANGAGGASGDGGSPGGGGSDSGGRATGGTGGTETTGGSPGDGGSASTGGSGTGGTSTGGKGSGGSASGLVECMQPDGPLVVTDGSYGDNGTLCGYIFTMTWSDAVASPGCAEGPCFTDGNICADFSLPAAVADPDPDDGVEEGYYPGGGIGFQLRVGKVGEGEAWSTTDTGILIDWTVDTLGPDGLTLQVTDLDDEAFCIVDPRPNVVYHWSEFTKDCWLHDPTSERLGVGHELQHLSILVQSTVGEAVEVENLCVNNIQVFDGLVSDCAEACLHRATACEGAGISGYDRDYCKYTCYYQVTSDYSACQDEWDSFVSCEAGESAASFSCDSGYIEQTEEYDCFTAADDYSACLEGL